MQKNTDSTEHVSTKEELETEELASYIAEFLIHYYSEYSPKEMFIALMIVAKALFSAVEDQLDEQRRNFLWNL